MPVDDNLSFTNRILCRIEKCFTDHATEMDRHASAKLFEAEIMYELRGIRAYSQRIHDSRMSSIFVRICV